MSTVDSKALIKDLERCQGRVLEISSGCPVRFLCCAFWANLKVNVVSFSTTRLSSEIKITTSYSLMIIFLFFSGGFGERKTSLRIRYYFMSIPIRKKCHEDDFYIRYGCQAHVTWPFPYKQILVSISLNLVTFILLAIGYKSSLM